MAVVGYYWPQAAIAYRPVMPPLLAALFLILGLTRDASKWLSAGKALHFHVLLQTCSLVITPIIYFFVVRKPGWDVSSGMLTEALGVGVVVAMAMPTTAATSLVFVQQARGDAAVAAINMSLGQLLGCLTAPPLITVLLVHGHNSGGSTPLKTIGKMCYELVLPMIVGILTQILAERWRPGSRRQLKRLSILNIPALFALFLLIFAKSFKESKGVLSVRVAAKLLGWMTVTHLVILAVTWLVATTVRLSKRRRLAFVLVAPQKTEGLAIALVASISAELGPGMPLAELTLPIVSYHAIQMVVASLLVPFVRLPQEDMSSDVPSDMSSDITPSCRSRRHPDTYSRGPALPAAEAGMVSNRAAEALAISNGIMEAAMVKAAAMEADGRMREAAEVMAAAMEVMQQQQQQTVTLSPRRFTEATPI